MLAAQLRETGQVVAGAGRSVAAGAGRHAGFQVATTEQRFATGDQLGIGLADAALLAGEVGGDVGQVLIAHVVQQAGHLHHGTLTTLDVLHLLQQVALTLAGQLREVRRHAVAIGAVAGAADGCLGLSGGGITSGVGHTGHAHGQQQTHE
ncbi:hypothetical protein D9M71_391350 [compost metagenome]